MSGKRYSMVDPNTAKPTPFEIQLWRDGQAEVHEFTACPVTDIGAVMMFSSSGDDGEMKARALMRMMSRMLLNTDGVPAQWSPEPLAKPKNAGLNWQPKFRGPDGKLYPLSEQGQFTDPKVGSSRRRWDYLMFEDDGVAVDAGLLSEIVQDMIATAADRPTHASSPA